MRRLLSRRGTVTAIAVLAVVTVAIGGVAIGGIPADDGLIHACYAKPGLLRSVLRLDDGDLRLVSEGTPCKSYEKRITWNQQGIQGEPGMNGADGQNGTDGVAGADGADGATWFVGESPPASDMGSEGDLYLDRLTADVYRKQSGEWTVVANLTGPKGDAGADGQNGADGQDGKDGQNGADGQDGADGTRWFTGTGAPGGGPPFLFPGAKLNDLYLDTDTGKVWRAVADAQGGAFFSEIASLKGPKGDKGDKGDRGDDGVSGYEVVDGFFEVQGVQGKNAGVLCPSGKTAIGGGLFNMQDEHVESTSLNPIEFHVNAARNGYEVLVNNINPDVNQRYNFGVQVICVFA